MRDAANINSVASLSPDYMGFIFYDRSPRSCVGMQPDLVKGLPGEVTPVMVTVNMGEEDILKTAEKYGISTVQLHGQEMPEVCFSLRSRGMKVIKAMGIRTESHIDRLREYVGSVDLFLLDTLSASGGGSGRKFDWSVLEGYDLDEPFLLSGGIGEDDVERILQLRHPKLSGVDVNSRFELQPGIKDAERLSRFFNALRAKHIPHGN